MNRQELNRIWSRIHAATPGDSAGCNPADKTFMASSREDVQMLAEEVERLWRHVDRHRYLETVPGLQCPCCGATTCQKLFRDDPDDPHDPGHDPFWFVSCDGCGARSGMASTRQGAIDKWGG